MEDKIIIDLEEAKLLKEYSASLVSFGAKIKKMLYNMFSDSGESFTNFYVKGKRPDVITFGAALASEKKYMDSYLKHGLNDPRVLKNRYSLERSIKNFERETGIKWPLK
ncbi:MAG: hypothetical protein CML17_10895 [Pusillimonas sp.]|jgi:hypothetical protein|nr:hypothetical protein [Pusillimonas sp.]